jgi:hypothetical protein
MDVQGDYVIVGANTADQIVSIDYVGNNLTLANPITFPSGAGVSLQNSTDIGAFDYDPQGYSYNIALTSPTNFATTPGVTTLTANVTNPNKVRIVRFYVDGLEVGNSAPSATVSVTAVISGTNDIVQVRAYALYADTNVVITSSITVNPIIPPWYSDLQYVP